VVGVEPQPVGGGVGAGPSIVLVLCGAVPEAAGARSKRWTLPLPDVTPGAGSPIAMAGPRAASAKPKCPPDRVMVGVNVVRTSNVTASIRYAFPAWLGSAPSAPTSKFPPIETTAWPKSSAGAAGGGGTGGGGVMICGGAVVWGSKR